MKAQQITSEILYNAYLKGYFPMADPVGKITWHYPNMRAVFEINTYKPKKSLIPFIKTQEFDCSINQHFEEVIRTCANPRKPYNGTWLNEELIKGYIDLHYQGHAHSVEIFKNDQLVGGLYGVQIGSAFFGESMFSKVSNASKIAFHYLIERLKSQNFTLLDSQYLNHHTAMLGAIEIPANIFKENLNNAIHNHASFT